MRVTPDYPGSYPGKTAIYLAGYTGYTDFSNTCAIRGGHRFLVFSI
jgi:hypothetical protein